ncbi:MAG: hypothetical protein NTX50_08365 [Candidatus Sumerlaeota bacterium]|nr:hypothetical protein [Candidatus Sumerlaeota bacterium]
MSENNLFNTPEQEIGILSREMKETRDILRDLSRKISRIELRTKRAFPSALSDAPPRIKDKADKITKPTMSTEEAMHFYDELVEQAKRGNIEDIIKRLDTIELSDLNLLRIELGASLGKKKPSRQVLIETILGRINQSVMLVKHVNRQELINQNFPSVSAIDKIKT